MKFQLFIALFLTMISSSFAQTNCTVKTRNYCVVLDWVEGPNFGTYSSARIEFYDSQDKLVTPKEVVKVYPWMIMHGHAHGSRPVEASFISEGIFEVSKIFFMQGMMGTWQLKLDLDSDSYVLYSIDV